MLQLNREDQNWPGRLSSLCNWSPPQRVVHSDKLVVHVETTSLEKAYRLFFFIAYHLNFKPNVSDVVTLSRSASIRAAILYYPCIMFDYSCGIFKVAHFCHLFIHLSLSDTGYSFFC